MNELLKYVIINEIDRPDKRHIVDRETGKYLEPSLSEYSFKDFERATPIIKFGFSFRDGEFILERESIAEYSEGRKRKWQGEKRFRL